MHQFLVSKSLHGVNCITTEILAYKMLHSNVCCRLECVRSLLFAGFLGSISIEKELVQHCVVLQKLDQCPGRSPCKREMEEGGTKIATGVVRNTYTPGYRIITTL